VKVSCRKIDGWDYECLARPRQDLSHRLILNSHALVMSFRRSQSDSIIYVRKGYWQCNGADEYYERQLCTTLGKATGGVSPEETQDDGCLVYKETLEELSLCSFIGLIRP